MVLAISEIEDTAPGKRPIIVTFQNSDLQQGEEGKLSTGIFKRSKSKTLVGVATKNILYTGEISKHSDPDELYNRFLLVSNRRTGKVRLVAVDSVLVTPQITSQPREAADGALNPNSSINELNKEFGSKKIKRITEQRERLKMNIDDVKEHLEKTVSGIELDESGTFSFDTAENDSIYRPPIDRNAASVDQVYVLNEMVPQVVLDSLEEEAAAVFAGEDGELTPFVKEKLTELKASGGGAAEKTKLLLYLDYLIKFIVRPAKAITKKFVACPTSPEVNSHILENFSVLTSSGRTRPVAIRDKTICYILVLAMIACNYQLDVENLSRNVKMGFKKLQEMGRILAFSAQAKNKNVMVLKIPLPPAVSMSPKKRRR